MALTKTEIANIIETENESDSELNSGSLSKIISVESEIEESNTEESDTEESVIEDSDTDSDNESALVDGPIQNAMKPREGRPYSSSMFIQHNYPLGIEDENVELPKIPKGSKVLDIGAGTSFIGKRIKDTFACDVYALEPSFESSSDFASCVERLGEDHVEQLMLQEALEKFPEKYFQAFDVVCVFKYNVPSKQKEDFIRALSQVVKPDGLVYVTSVELKRFTLDRHEEAIYLTNTFRKYFDVVSFVTRRSLQGADQLMTLRGPRLELDSDSELNSGSLSKVISVESNTEESDTEGSVIEDSDTDSSNIETSAEPDTDSDNESALVDGRIQNAMKSVSRECRPHCISMFSDNESALIDCPIQNAMKPKEGRPYSSSMFIEHNNPLGIEDENVELPMIPKGSKNS